MKLMPISFPCSFAGLPVYVASSQSAIHHETRAMLGYAFA